MCLAFPHLDKQGEKVKVKWSVTIPHHNDRKDSGVRIALQYIDTTSLSLQGRVFAAA